MSWSAQQYSLFERQRTRPVHDLLAAVPRDDVELAVDLGCGPGNSTAVLQAHAPQARVVVSTAVTTCCARRVSGCPR